MCPIARSAPCGAVRSPERGRRAARAVLRPQRRLRPARCFAALFWALRGVSMTSAAVAHASDHKPPLADAAGRPSRCGGSPRRGMAAVGSGRATPRALRTAANTWRGWGALGRSLEEPTHSPTARHGVQRGGRDGAALRRSGRSAQHRGGEGGRAAIRGAKTSGAVCFLQLQPASWDVPYRSRLAASLLCDAIAMIGDGGLFEGDAAVWGGAAEQSRGRS